MTTQNSSLSREQVEGAQAILAALTGLRTGGFATAGTAGMGQPSETAAGQPIAGGPQSMQPASPADLLGAIYGALNQQAAKVPGASKAVGLARQGSEALRGWAAEAPAGSDMRKSRETFSRLYDFAIPQDELGALLAVIPPVRTLKVGEEAVERAIFAGSEDVGRVIVKKRQLYNRPGGSGTVDYPTQGGQDVIQVMSSGIQPEVRGLGIGMRTYQNAVDETLEAGMPFVSDRVVSASAQKIYKSLIEKGYDVVENPNVKIGKDGYISSTDSLPVFRVVAGPKVTSQQLIQRLVGTNDDDAVDILEELQRRGYDPDLAKSIPLDRRTPPEPGRRKP